jgi:hypothetical protein
VSWQIDPEDGITRVHSTEESTVHSVTKAAESPAQASPLATNTAGQSVNDALEVSHATEEPASSSPPSVEAFHAQEAEEQRKHMVAVADNQSRSPTKPSDDPTVNSSTDDHEATNDLSASTATIKPVSETKERSETKEQPKLSDESEGSLAVVKEKLESIVGGKEALQGPKDDDAEKEQMPGSFE